MTITPAAGSVSVSRPEPRWNRPFLLLTASLLVVSSVFPTAAGLAKDVHSLPGWWGELDVAIALVTGVLIIVIEALLRPSSNRRAEEQSYRIYRVAIHGILATAVVVMFFGAYVNWTQCATGFLWRIWLLLYWLPSWLSALVTVR